MMEQKFRTSFIPKRPQVSAARRRRGVSVSILFLGGLIVFLGALALSVGIFFYQQILVKSIEEKTIALEKAQAAFEPTLIAQLLRLDTRIKSAEEILDNHVALTSFFDLLESTTLKSIQFQNFSYTASPGGEIQIVMEGLGRSFSSVALQSDVFSKNPVINNPLFSNFSVSDLGEATFDFTASVSPSSFLYRSSVQPLTQR